MIQEEEKDSNGINQYIQDGDDSEDDPNRKRKNKSKK